MFNGEIIFHKKDTEKVVLLHYKWKTQYQVLDWKNIVHISFMHQTSFCQFIENEISCKKAILYQYSRKEWIESFYYVNEK